MALDGAPPVAKLSSLPRWCIGLLFTRLCARCGKNVDGSPSGISTREADSDGVAAPFDAAPTDAVPTPGDPVYTSE